MADGSPRIDVPLARVRRHGRKYTMSNSKYAKSELAHGRKLYPPSINKEYDRPQTRGDCLNGNNARPCPWVSCGYHLAHEVDPQRGGLIPSYQCEVDELPATCALDIADEGPHGGPEVGHLMGISRERVRQIEVQALDKARLACAQLGLRFEDLFHERETAIDETEPDAPTRGEVSTQTVGYRAHVDRARRLIEAVDNGETLNLRSGLDVNGKPIDVEAIRARIAEMRSRGVRVRPVEVARWAGWL